jgi:predicted nucleic acid-binding protein
MLKRVILDTGVLVAVLDRSDNYHNWAIQQWEKVAKPLLTCEAVITESCFILQDVYGSEDAIMSLIERGTIKIDFSLNDEVKVIRELR